MVSSILPGLRKKVNQFQFCTNLKKNKYGEINIFLANFLITFLSGLK
jgi:hypothetical protein